MFSSRTLLAGLLGVVGASGGLLSAPSYAQSPPPAPTANGMTITSSNVDQFLLTPEGVVDGLLLQNNTIVRFSGNMRREISQRVRPGDLVVASGTPEGAGQLHASKLEDRTAQITISEIAPSGPPSSGERQAMRVSGTVRVLTRSPRGDVDGAVLSNGVVIHVVPEAAPYFSAILRPDQPLAATGWGTINQFGKSVEASELGPSIDKLTPVQQPPMWIPPSNPPSTR